SLWRRLRWHGHGAIRSCSWQCPFGDLSEQSVFGQLPSSIPDDAELQARSLSYVEQRMMSVRQIQYPEPGEVLDANRSSASGVVQTSTPEGRLTVGIRVPVDAIVFKQVDDLPTHVERLR